MKVVGKMIRNDGDESVSSILMSALGQIALCTRRQWRST